MRVLHSSVHLSTDEFYNPVCCRRWGLWKWVAKDVTWKRLLLPPALPFTLLPGCHGLSSFFSVVPLCHAVSVLEPGEHRLNSWTLKFRKQGKERLVGDSVWSPEDQNAGRNPESRGQAQEISIENRDSVASWITGQVCHILVENVSLFCPCPKTVGD